MPRPFAPLLAALVLVPAVLSTAVPARADNGHSSGSAADQYVEAIPSGGSNTPTGGPAGKSAPIQPRVKRAIRRAGGSDKAALRAIVSSPSFGVALGGHARAPLGAPIRVDDASRIVADEKV